MAQPAVLQPAPAMATRAASSVDVDVSVIIVNYNGEHLLPQCLQAVQQAAGSCTLETIVVDNGSTDNSVKLLRQVWRPTHLLEAGANLGFSRANNAGIAVARGRYVLLLNTDCFVSPNLLEVLVGYLDTDPCVAAVGPRLLNPDGSLQPSCHNFPQPLVLLLEQSTLWKWLRRVPIVSERLFIASDHCRPRAVDWLAGACLLLRPRALASVNGLDEDFPFYWEETDLCLRLRQQKWQIVFVPSAQAVHLGGGSTSARSQVQFFRSLYQFYRKHYSPRQFALARLLIRSMALLKAGRSALTCLRGARSAAGARAALAGWLAVMRL